MHSQHPGVCLCLCNESISKHVGVAFCCRFGLLLFASDNVVLDNAMHLVRGRLCRHVASSLLSDHMNENRANR